MTTRTAGSTATGLDGGLVVGTHKPAAASTQPLLEQLSRLVPGVRLRAYDGGECGPQDARATITIRSAAAFAHLIRAPRGLGLARAWVRGDIDINGDPRLVVSQEQRLRDPRTVAAIVRSCLGLLRHLNVADLASAGPTAIEFRGSRPPGRHTVASDLAETEFHYGRDLAFYEALLGPSLTYSCAIFPSPEATLEHAQARKHDIITTKIAPSAESVLLDIGCGWGSFLRHATNAAGCTGIGITASRAQYDAIIAAAPARITAFHGDYRQLLPKPGITAAVSIGMYEHVGATRSPDFFRLVRRTLPTGARYLNQAITRPEHAPASFRRNSFVQRYIFPNGQLNTVSAQLRDLERASFRIVSVETFGLHYAATINRWLANLQAHREACVILEGEQRVRAWEMYLLGSQARFENRYIDLAQVLTEAC